MRIDDFKSLVLTKGLSRANRFEIAIFQPQLASDMLRDLNLVCDSVTMPGRTIATDEIQTWNQAIKMPYTFIDDDVTLTFLLTNDYFARKLFESWQARIMDPGTYKMKYKVGSEGYAGTMSIKQIDDRNKSVYEVELQNCFPTNISAIELANGSEGTISTMTVTMAYDRYNIK